MLRREGGREGGGCGGGRSGGVDGFEELTGVVVVVFVPEVTHSNFALC